MILNLESIQENLYSLASKDHDAILQYYKSSSQTKGLNYKKIDAKNLERVAKFNHSLELIKRQLKSLAHKYSEFVKKYLSLLSSSPDMNLQLLSVRLNFNDYYKIT